MPKECETLHNKPLPEGENSRRQDDVLEGWADFEVEDLRRIGKEEQSMRVGAEKNVLVGAFRFCLEHVVSKKEFDLKAGQEIPLFQWATADDIAFSILAMENYMNKWMMIARHEYRMGVTLKQKELRELPNVNEYAETRSGWSGERGKARYLELRTYANRIVTNPARKKEVEDSFARFYKDNNNNGSSGGGSSRKRKRPVKVDITKDDELADTMEEDMRMLFGNDVFETAVV